MTECEMSGCYDTAEYWVSFKYELGVYEICESCADYWHKDEEYPATIKPFANNLKPFYFDKAATK
jgi:hypothetical protein